MTSKDEVDAQNNGTSRRTVDEVVDVKPTNDGATRVITASGNAQEVEGAGDFMAKLNTGNIVIDPALAEKAAKGYSSPPLTIAEALERGDFQALARMMQAQIARAENGDLEGMRYEDAQRYAARLSEKEAQEERIRDRERELTAYFDSNGGYRDRQGGYYNVKEGTFTDEDGGTVDNYGGYRYKNGDYKSRFGDFYDAKTNTVHLRTGEVVKPPKGTTADQVIREMQEDVKQHGGYDPNLIKNSQMGAANSDHPPPTKGVGTTEAREIAERAKANHGPDLDTAATRPAASPPSAASSSTATSSSPATSAPSAGATASSLKDRLAKLRGGSNAPASASPATPVTTSDAGAGTKPKESKFSDGSPADIARSARAEVTNSSFFAVDSSISASKFPVQQPEATVSDTDPVVTTSTTTAQRPVPKSPAP
jgi:hypothetical protein